MISVISKVFGHGVEVVIHVLSNWETWLFLLLIGFIASAPIFPSINLLALIRDFILYTWWFWAFFILFGIFGELFLYWRQQLFKEKELPADNFSMLEIRIPREMDKSPKAMAQVFGSLHMLGNSAGSWHEKYLDGVVPIWSSLEIVKTEGVMHFYIRVPKKNRHLVEVAFFSNYPDVEIVDVKDYMRNLPATTAELYAREMDLWGTEMKLGTEDAYPIKTFADFDSAEKQSDPISVFIEVLGKLSNVEVACIQIIISPASKDWAKKWEGVLDKLREMKMVDAGDAKVPLPPTPGKTAVVAAVEGKLTKSAFNTLIRICYMAPATVMKTGSAFARGGIVAAFNQYASPKLNSFKGNSETATRVDKWTWPHVNLDKRLEYRKQRMLYNVRERVNPPETFTARLLTSFMYDWNLDSKYFELSIDELATVFHPPSSVVLTAPHMQRVESKKAGPPSGLPIFGEESNLEKFRGEVES